jgi:hypothetical protein
MAYLPHGLLLQTQLQTPFLLYNYKLIYKIIL